MTEIELKAAVYDQLVEIEKHQRAIKAIQDEIVLLNKQLNEIKKPVE